MQIGSVDRDEVLRALRTGGWLPAVAALRHATGADVVTARRLLDATVADANPDELYGEGNMGMSANVLAIGPYSPTVKGHMEYPAKFYSGTREGAPILRDLFDVHEGSSRSRELASCFGIDPWDFNQHEIDASQANIEKLVEMFGDEEVATFLALRGAGFRFYFRPNG